MDDQSAVEERTEINDFDSTLLDFAWTRQRGRVARFFAIARKLGLATASDIAVIVPAPGKFAGEAGFHARIVTGWHPEFNYALKTGEFCEPSDKRWDGSGHCWHVRGAGSEVDRLKEWLAIYFPAVITVGRTPRDTKISLGKAAKGHSPEPSFDLLEEPYELDIDGILSEIQMNEPFVESTYVLTDFAFTGKLLGFYRVDKLKQAGKLYTRYPLLLFRSSVSGGRPRYFSFNILAKAFDEKGYHGDKRSKMLIGRYRSAIESLKAPILQPLGEDVSAQATGAEPRLVFAEEMFRKLVADYNVVALPAFHYTISDLTDALAWTPSEPKLVRVGVRMARAASAEEAFPVAFSRKALRELDQGAFTRICLHEFAHVIDFMLAIPSADFFPHGHSWVAAVAALRFLDGKSDSDGSDYLLFSGHCHESTFYGGLFQHDAQAELKRLEAMVRNRFQFLENVSERPYSLDEICLAIEYVVERWENELDISSGMIRNFAKENKRKISSGHH